MLDILKIIYQFEHHAATTFEISLVREKLGYVGEKSYNSLIAHNGKRVKEFLKKDAILRDNGEELFWGIFFDGEQLDGKTIIHTQVRVGRSAVSGGWTLNRQDLNEFLPVENFEGIYPITVDGIEAEGRFNVNSRVFYKSDELRKHLEQLAEEDPNQKIPLKLELKDENKRGFQFKLKDELVKAIETLYEDLEVKYPHSLKILEELNDLKYDFKEEDFEEGKTLDNVSFYDYLTEKGYLFDKETIENYLLSLKVKPFAILTGNSGTGKTKLSQLFAQYLNNSLEVDISNGEIEENPEYIHAKVKASTIIKNNEATIKKEYLNKYLPINDYLGHFDGFIDDIPSGIGLNIVSYIRFKRSFIKEHIEPNYTPDDIIDIKIKLSDIIDFLPKPDFKGFAEFKFNTGSLPKFKIRHMNKEDHINFFNLDDRLRDCEVIIDGVSTVGRYYIYDTIVCLKSDETDAYFEELSRENGKKTITIKLNLDTFENLIDSNDDEESDDYGIDYSSNPNYKIIPVGANWTENRHIVGYYNVITNEYQSTPAYDLIKAANDSTEPNFLILDEMNLSHVERYFADFLSAIESGEKIPLYGEEELTLPENLFIIGTVNVDETTYMFSPKVLDRANVIEFETYSAKDYMNNKINLTAPSGNISYLENPLAGNEIREYGIDELRDFFEDVTVDGEPFWNILTEEIFSFQKILKESGFDFGFRVINEIVRFMAVAWEYENKPEEFANWTRYFDACIKQKMLPKLHGSEKIIGETLEKLYKECLSSTIDKEEMAKYPESYKKLKEMKIVLNKQRYVSFIN